MPPRRVFPLTVPKKGKNTADAPRISVSIARGEQLTPALIDAGADLLYFPVELIDSLDLSPYLGKTEFCAVLPRIYRTKDETNLISLQKKCEEKGVRSAAVGNIGHLPLVRETSLIPRGDFGLNVFNSMTLRVLRDLGLDSATLSFELRKEQLRDLDKCLPCEAIVYGRLPLMIMENCIIASNLGCKYGTSRCDAPSAESRCEQVVELTDRKGEKFPVLRAFGCRNEIQNGKTLCLTQRDVSSLGLSYMRLRFTTESPEECVRVLRAYRSGKELSLPDFTRGLFLRGVE
jgi:putative protease